MIVDRRSFIAASAVSALVPSGANAVSGASLRPEDFGARGDGKTNDTRAFVALAAEIQRRGGGSISLGARRTYIVGAQDRGDGPWGWNPSPIIKLDRLVLPLQILGNGARLRAQPGLRFGSFDLQSGNAVSHSMPNHELSDLASPYRAMIWLSNCSAPIIVRDIELDGNAELLTIGGQFGDKGWQIPATGLLLRLNSHSETIENVLTHHHALDGATFVGLPGRSARSRVSGLVSRFNGRQGLSITGGQGYDFANCEFSHTGRGAIHSAPGAGVDIEAEGRRTIRDLSFTRCKFVDNAGCGVVADSGDSDGARFTDCTFVGTTSWSAWPRKPRFSFANCTFVGAVAHAFADPDPSRAAHFTACRFTDDPTLSPTGKVFSGRATGGPIANLAVSDNVTFDRCTFDLVGLAKLPTSQHAIYRDCVMRQRSSGPSSPRGTYLGQSTISGNVSLGGSMVEGDVALNGRRLARGRQGR
ncbi:MAG: right-handed parallel beta-helix repeat-containing protein [Sphingomicrobium sp.]